MKDKKPKQEATSAELEAQAAELAKRLSALEAEERSLDGLADFERVAVLAGQRSALAKALDLANERIAEARRAEKQAAEAAAEVAKTERKLRAIGAARGEVRSLASVLSHLDQSVLSGFDAAIGELYAAGGWLPQEVGAMVRFRRQLADFLEDLRRIDPTLLGLPPAPSKQDVMIAEARSDLEEAKRLHSDALALDWRNGTDRQRRIDATSEGVLRAQKRLSELTGESFILDNARAELARLARYLPIRQPAEREEVMV